VLEAIEQLIKFWKDPSHEIAITPEKQIQEEKKSAEPKQRLKPNKSVSPR